MSRKNTISLNQCPRFIVDKPEGKDLFVGQSQDRVADNIVQFITENENASKKVIGIEGEWGSGKSNVIEILRRKLKEQYYFFVFDAWGHQVDLTRRSILEELLIKLKDDGILKNKKNIFNENEKENEWDTKLRDLLSRKIDTEKKNIPKLSWGIIFSIIAILLVPITKELEESYMKSCTIAATNTTKEITPHFSNYLIAALILLSSFSLLIGWLVIKWCKAKKGDKNKVFEELFYIYKGEEIVNTSRQTISEREPSVLQFTEFLSDLEKGALPKKLVIVFDNMDRLPAEKVKEIWSSIHTFFGSDDNGLNTWAIVPFDNEHICNIFIDDDKNKTQTKHRSDSYIHKTFSIVFHIPPPILSDWKKFFSDKFEEAFVCKPPGEQQLETIFDYHHFTDSKIKPRDIICFVNDLVALRKLTEEKIDFKYLALFALKRDKIMEKPFEQILSREYLISFRTLFDFDEQLDENISALAFNVPKEDAAEVLLKRPIEKAFNGERNLLKVCNNKSFFDIFRSVFYATPMRVVRFISLLNELPVEVYKNHDMSGYWDAISHSIDKEIFTPEYVSTLIVLIKKLHDKRRIGAVITYIFQKAIEQPANDRAKPYWGSGYYKLIIEIEGLLKEVWEEKNIQELLCSNVVSPNEYINFIKECPYDDIDRFKVSCTDAEINSFLTSTFNDAEISGYAKELKVINSKFDLTKFKNGVNELVSHLSIELYQAKPYLVKNIFDVGKILSVDGGILFNIPGEIAFKLLMDNPSSDQAVDLILSIINTHIVDSNSDGLSNEIFVQLLDDLKDKDRFIQAYKYYFNYGDLIKYWLQSPRNLIKGVIKELTCSEKEIEIATSDIPFLILNYEEITRKLLDNDNELSKAFLLKIDKFYQKESLINFVTNDNLLLVTLLIRNNNTLNCILINDIILESIKFINGIDKDSWLLSLKTSAISKEISLFTVLDELPNHVFDKLPLNLNVAYCEAMELISNGGTPVPVEATIWNMLFQKHTENLNTFKNIRDRLLTPLHALVSIDELLFFEKGLFDFGKLDQDKDIADEVLRRIFIPLLSNEKCIECLKRNAQSIYKIIEKAQDSIISFKTNLDSFVPRIAENPEIQQFYNLLSEKYDELNTPIELKEAQISE